MESEKCKCMQNSNKHDPRWGDNQVEVQQCARKQTNDFELGRNDLGQNGLEAFSPD